MGLERERCRKGDVQRCLSAKRGMQEAVNASGRSR